jgi:predicted permease
MFLVALGAVLKKTIANDAWTEVLNKLAIYLLFPALIFSGMVKVDLESIDDFSFIYANFIILVLIIATLYGVTKSLGFSKRMTNTYVISVFFGNVGYLGFPILSSLLPGYEGIVSMHIALYTLILFTFGIGVLEFSVHQKIEAKILKDTLKNPLLVAVLVSIVILMFDIKLPFVVTKTIDLLAGGATPIILISLGIFLARELPKNIDYRHVAGLISLKLVAMPMLFFLYFMLSGKTDIVAISVLEAGMPMAITPFILAEIYPMEREVIALSIVISCLLSVITLPIIMVLVGVV